MTLRSAMTFGALVQTLACNARSDDVAERGAGAEAATSLPADSLVATAPGGVEIWFTLARESKAADGTPCIDRTLEIRRDTVRIPVPLLYTGAAPELVNDSTIRARLSNQCVPGQAYLVNLRTGRPVPER
ncbi:MAG: hypothetical protein ACREM9_12220 [Gemmatimonadales bacterium]